MMGWQHFVPLASHLR